MERLLSIVIPVFNEAGNICVCLRQLYPEVEKLDHEILICYDFEGDTTLPAVEEMEDRPPTVRLVKNELGRGVSFAIQAGFQAAKGDCVVVTMADLSDPPDRIPAMVKMIREDRCHVVSGSRYMPGGSQTGGPWLKAFLSKMAGLSLHYLAGLGTHDCTTSFRAYGKPFLEAVTVESESGFALGIELTVKAHLAGLKVGEVPSTWKDRSEGESRFRLFKWLPTYLRWFFLCLVFGNIRRITGRPPAKLKLPDRNAENKDNV